jgi:hypothetical protein
VTDTDAAGPAVGEIPAEFAVIPVPIGKYAHPGHEELPVEPEVEDVVRLLAQLGAPHVTPPPADLTKTAVNDHLAGWAESYPRSAGNSILYWLGHGQYTGQQAWLACQETRHPIRDGMTPGELADKLREEWGRRSRDEHTWTVLVVEACGAAGFARLLASDLDAKSNTPERLLVVGAGGTGQNDLGHFYRALDATMASYTDNDDHINLSDFAGRLEGYLNHQGAGTVRPFRLSAVPPLPRARQVTGSVTAPIDVYRELRTLLAGLDPDLRGHFLPKAQGGEYGELAWHFVGRATERAQIGDWLHNETRGMLVVTGRAGAGKSALLGNVFAYSHPALREVLVRAGQLEPLPEEQLPPQDGFDAIVHLTGATIGDVTRRLSEAAGIPLTPTEGAADPRSSGTGGGRELEWLLGQLDRRTKMFTILADALDEAQDPLTMASAVFRRLSRLPHIRVVIGTRASTKEGPDQPTPTDQDLLDALGATVTTRTEVRVLQVQRDPAAIQTYVTRRLTAKREELGVDDGTIADVAAAVRFRDDQEILFARLLVHEILADPKLLRPPLLDTCLPALLRADHRRLFATAVERLATRSPAFEPLLAALALARGRGAPRADGIWALMAEAISADSVTIGETDIDELLVAAAPYVMLDREYGQSVYRLSHRTFQEYFVRQMAGSAP